MLRVAFDKKLRGCKKHASQLPDHHTFLRGCDGDRREGCLPVRRAQRALLLCRSRLILWGARTAAALAVSCLALLALAFARASSVARAAACC